MLLSAIPADPGGDVLRVFKARCAGCHSSAAIKVQGDFDFVLDLQRLAADRGKVSPGDPANSDLWKLVVARNMPPNGSPTGALNDAQIAAIKTWIAAGAPPAVEAPPVAMGPEEVPSPFPPLDDTGGASAESESFLMHLGRWSGELHLLLLHFPIVCLLAAGFSEASAWKRGQIGAPATASFCLWTAALVAVPTVICGWVYSSAGHGAGTTLSWHRWLGTSGGVMAVVAALVHSHGGIVLMPAQHALARRSFLSVAAALVVVAAHLGGKLAFGPGFLGW